MKNLSCKEAASLMGVSVEFIHRGLQDGTLPFGAAVKLEKWTYYISPVKFAEFTGLEIGESNE